MVNKYVRLEIKPRHQPQPSHNNHYAALWNFAEIYGDSRTSIITLLQLITNVNKNVVEIFVQW